MTPGFGDNSIRRICRPSAIPGILTRQKLPSRTAKYEAFVVIAVSDVLEYWAQSCN
jgi:hypothetical protein